jgi:hypothetical protein
VFTCMGRPQYRYITISGLAQASYATLEVVALGSKDGTLKPGIYVAQR